MADSRTRPDPLTLLRALGAGEQPPHGTADRVLSRVAATLAVELPVAPAKQPLAPREPVASDANSRLPLRSGPSGGGPLGVVRRLLVGRPLLVSVAFALGAGAHAALVPAHVRVVYLERPESTRATPIATASLHAGGAIGSQPSASASVEPEPSLTSDVRRVGPERPPPVGPTALQRERALLDAARRSLSNGDSTNGLARLKEYTRTFPRGQLSEEREALQVNALVRSGAYVDARQAARAFHATHPGSFLSPAVDAAIAAIPAANK